MAQKGVVFDTSLTMSSCRDVFETAAGDANGLFGKAMHAGAKAAGGTLGQVQGGFYEPTLSHAEALDGHPDFAYGATILSPVLTKMRSGGTPIHLYVFDRGDRREVQLVSSHGLTGGGGSRNVVKKFFEHFQAADSDVTLTTGDL